MRKPFKNFKTKRQLRAEIEELKKQTQRHEIRIESLDVKTLRAEHIETFDIDRDPAITRHYAEREVRKMLSDRAYAFMEIHSSHEYLPQGPAVVCFGTLKVVKGK